MSQIGTNGILELCFYCIGPYCKPLNSGRFPYLKVDTFPLSPLFYLGCDGGENVVVERGGRHLVAGLI